MSAIGPGDWVECVDASPRHGLNTSWRLLACEALYRVEDCYERSGVPWVRLIGLRSNDVSRGFWADRFRPIYRPRADLIESLLAPLPEHVLEQA